MHWLKKAFAVDPPGPAIPTEPQKTAVDILCNEIIRRHLATPSLLSLEMLRPLNFLASQAMHFFTPFLSVFVNTGDYEQFVKFLEQRGSIEYICRRIEHLEAERENLKCKLKNYNNNDDADADADASSLLSDETIITNPQQPKLNSENDE